MKTVSSAIQFKVNKPKSLNMRALTNEQMVERLSQIFNLKKDGDVSDLLGISKQNFSDWRAGRRKLPAMAVVKGWDKLDYSPSRESLLDLLGDAGDEIRKIDRRLAAEAAETKASNTRSVEGLRD